MIYLDHSAATPLSPEVLKKMMPYLKEQYGNPSSIHALGRKARAAIEEARSKLANFTGAAPKEVFFTGGGTEANNWAIFALAEANKNKGKHIISTQIEHESVLGPLAKLEKQGMRVTYLKPDKNGIISPATFKKAITKQTIFASIIYANNEIGTIQNIPELTKILRAGTEALPFHTDACQATNYLPMKINKLGADLMTINSGKIYGPKGAGALIIKTQVAAQISPYLVGGGQEFRKRAGTENVAAIVGFAEAISQINPATETAKTTKLRDHFIKELLKIPGITLNGDPKKRLPNNVNIKINAVASETMLIRLDMVAIAASAGSACSAGALEPSHVLLALGLTKKQAAESIRFTLGHTTTKSEITEATNAIKEILQSLQNHHSKPRKRATG